jgi:hypothetical protein
MGGGGLSGGLEVAKWDIVYQLPEVAQAVSASNASHSSPPQSPMFAVVMSDV